MAVGDAYVFSGFLTPVLTKLFFPKPPTTFLTCFCRGERPKYAGKKNCLNRGSNSQPPGHESDMLTTEPTGAGGPRWGKKVFEILKALTEIVLESILGYSVIKQWVQEFNNGQTVVSINHLCVQSLSVTNDEIVGNVAKLLEADSRRYTVKTVLGTTCIKRPPALRDHCSDTTILLKAT